MVSKQRLSEITIDRICGWREEGRTLKWISERLKAEGIFLGESGVGWRCVVLGVDTPLRQQQASAHKPGRTYRRNGKVVRTFAPSEDARLLELRSEGLTLDRIALTMGRGKSSVQARLMSLARSADRNDDWP